MRKKRGAALPGAILLSSLIVLVSMILAIVLIETASFNNLTRIQDETALFFAEGYTKFKSDGSLPTDNNNFSWKIYEGENDIKALTANYKSGNGIAFCGVYDFFNEKTLAYQRDEIYMTVEGGITYLAGVVPMVN